MRYSYNWLKKLSKTEKNITELANLVMLKGFELEGVEDLKKRFDNFVVGEIVSVEKHPNADKLRIAKVNIGTEGNLTIVCGAPNIEAGQKVPVALIGAILPNSKIEIKKTEIRGEKSEGMLCAEDELGIGKNHEGILILDEKTKVGSSLAEALEFNDEMIEFDVLPNRAHDCLSHEGMAREISAMENRKIKNQNSTLPTGRQEIKITDQSSKLLEIKIENKELCPRYMGAVLNNVEVKESPRWMQNILITCGMEPINNIVDITNYVMLEIGNPLHAFDLEKIKNQTQVEIIVRKAKKGEELMLLNDAKIELDENDLLITNGEKPLALAGIKGGKDSGISNETKAIVLEAANFNALNIRKSRQRHNLLTEAQARYEKNITPILAEKGLQRAIELFVEYAGAVLEEVVDVNYFDQKKNIIEIEFDKVNKLLGKNIEEKQAKSILENLGFEIISDKSGKMEIEVPYWRLDIEGPNDLAEEIGRISGYEKIESMPIESFVASPQRNNVRDLEWKARDLMNSLGFDEVISYSFYSREEAKLFEIKDEHFELKNSLIPQHALFRKTLIPGILEKVSLNAKNFDQFSIFEIGKIYNVGKNNNPEEQTLISGAFYSKTLSAEERIYFVKGKIEEFVEKLLNKSVETKSKSSSAKTQTVGNPFNSSRIAFLGIDGENIGRFGEIRKDINKFYSIKSDVVVFEICFNNLFEIYQTLEEKFYQPLRKYPVVERDLAMFVEAKTEIGEVKNLIKKYGSKSLISCELFDVYNDKDSNQKSLAFHFEFGDNERTMTGEEIDKIMEKIIKALEEAGHKVRKQ